MHSLRNAVGAILLLCVSCPATPQTVDTTLYLGPFTGNGAQLHPDNIAPNRIEYYGTDLGFSYQHGTQLQFLFGDSWATEKYAPIEASTGSRFDDGFGSVDLREWADPSRITPNHIPLIKLGQNPGTTEMSAINPGHAMDLGKTPMAGFSSGSREFGIFNITKPRGCTKDADCSDGLTCDTKLGYLGAKYTDEANLTLACRDGTPGCVPDTMTDAAGKSVPGSGFCADQTSVLRGERVSNLLSAVGLKVRIGLRNPDQPKMYGDTHDWLTNKFMNVTARTVKGEQRVLLWGRPGFVGVAADARSLGLYFAYVDMPGGAGYKWEPQYYAGSVSGTPKFSANQQDAVPLDLDSTRDGVQDEETIDVVNQMSVAWVEPLKKWVMFYGGGLSNLPTAALPACGVLQVFAGSECTAVVLGNGAVHMRSADQPWGAWTPPQDVIVGGDPASGPHGQYGPGGALRHPACTEPTCAPHSDMFAYNAREYGFFYSANIVAEWIRPAGDGVDVIWNASTWDPYRVVLLRTHIRK
ncbi:MAG TPA: hypothetical protein VEZ88_10785 [Steroidobacteraceae bacterium]|nr:hypothetical protein [Steroidobacteraceae bacterium]